MQMTEKEQRRLRDALGSLENGDWRRFNHNLWLAFGDRWLEMRRIFAETGRIRFRGSRDRIPEITDSGRRLLADLIANYGQPKGRRTEVKSA